MKVVTIFTRCAGIVGLGVALLFTSSCATSPQVNGAGAKFREEAFADLVLRYSSDQTIFMLKPDGRDGSFYRILNREEVRALDARRNGGRDLAVVLIGFNRAPEIERQIKESWVATLSELNYRRVVFLRSSDRDQINGLRVVEERQLARIDAPFSQVQVASAKP